MYLLAYEKDLSVIGFFRKDVHDIIPSPNLKISQGLWEKLIELGNFKIKEGMNLNKDLFDLEDIDLFEEITITQPKPKPSQIEEQNAFLIKESLEKDIQIKELNINLAQTTLKSINKDIEINNLNTNMAQTTLNLVNKDIQVKGIEKDIANLILKSLGGNLNG